MAADVDVNQGNGQERARAEIAAIGT